MSEWVGGLAEWDEGETTYLSVAFTWLLDADAKFEAAKVNSVFNSET